MIRTVKLLLLLLVCLITLAVLSVQSLCASRGNLVVDNEYLFSDSEVDELSDMLYKYSKKHECDLVVVTEEYVSDMQTYAENFYDRNGYGYGKDKTGVLLLISERNRSYYICLTGKATEIFSYSRLDELERAVVSCLKQNEYYEAGKAFATSADSIMESYNGFYMGDFIPAMIFTVVLAIGAGALTIVLMRKRMNNARPQRNASNYIRYGSFELTLAKDMYLYSTIRRVPKVKKTSSSGGGSGNRGGRGGRF